MASSSPTSSGSSSLIRNSGSEEDLQTLMDQRKRKRMISNRESARRSRMRKQKHLDDLTVQVTQLRKENQQIVTSIAITAQHYVNVEAENAILRAQLNELAHRLESLNEIIAFLNENANAGSSFFGDDGEETAAPAAAAGGGAGGGSFMNPFNMACFNQPIMASPDVFQY